MVALWVHASAIMTDPDANPAPLPFAGYPLDRASVKRRDPDAIAQLLNHRTTSLLLLHQGNPLLFLDRFASGPRRALSLAIGARSAYLGEKAPEPIFLGCDTHGQATFAAALPKDFDPEDSPLTGLFEIVEMREAASMLDGGDLALLSTAKALLDWHARHSFCGNCGGRTLSQEGGWKRICPTCNSEHFPRTDPVAIMLAVKDDKCLLGRGAGFRAGYISALAGFIEPGETIEEGCARELLEEAGVVMTKARIIANQPWPFPSQLMIGLIAEVADFTLTLDENELTDAIWFTKAQARELLSEGGCTLHNQTLRAPPPLAIAHHLIKAWVEEG
ncbi:MAG: hypothetical protein RLZZ157_244 [Pseudomonadota bacterium]|jgi:NAD+ diphosphatase